MPSPFPGMNPYLEHPGVWTGVHHLLISEIARFLSSLREDPIRSVRVACRRHSGVWGTAVATTGGTPATHCLMKAKPRARVLN